ncbi:hypothetical protein [Candidatus Avelusimicrobium luingense]|uniref:hypothetical protein n=1 Tax=Candidatus Avelusimicrobium luingense TaxID=3416211 RepID=UPI003D0E04E2
MNLSKIGMQVMVGAICFVAGAAAMQVWHSHQTRQDDALLSEVGETRASVWVSDMKDASIAPDMTDADAPAAEVQRVTVPSQLSKIDIQDVEEVLPKHGDETQAANDKNDDEPHSVVTLDESAQVTLQVPTKPAQQTTSADTKISMIEAPVKATLIKSLDDYRQFKRRARGNYPEVNFAKEQLLVLESESNLPDKVFDVTTVQEVDGKRVVSYRVSVFGLDKKINTHSVVIVDKKDLPLELKQVL